MTSNKRLVCPNCGSTNILYDDEKDMLYCANCGTVIEEDITIDAEPVYQQEYGESIHKPIGFLDQLTEDRNKKLMETFLSEVDLIIRKLSLPRQVRRLAGEYFLKLIKIGRKIPSNKVRHYAAALTYLAAKKLGIPISYRTLLKKLNLSSEKVSRVIQHARNIIKIDLKAMDIWTYLHYVLERLNVKNSDFGNEIMNLIREAQKQNLITGKDMRGVVGGAIYVVAKAFGIKITQRQIAEVCGITEITIRNRFLELAPIYRQLTGREVSLRKRKKRRPKVRF